MSPDRVAGPKTQGGTSAPFPWLAGEILGDNKRVPTYRWVKDLLLTCKTRGDAFLMFRQYIQHVQIGQSDQCGLRYTKSGFSRSLWSHPKHTPKQVQKGAHQPTLLRF